MLIKGILDKDKNLKNARLGHSSNNDQKLKYMHKIFHAVMRWWDVKRKEKALKMRLQQQKEASAKASQKNEESAF